jgi:hypothetical protein
MFLLVEEPISVEVSCIDEFTEDKDVNVQLSFIMYLLIYTILFMSYI